MLENWISWAKREPSGYRHLEVADSSQKVKELQEATKSELAELLLSIRFVPGFLEDMARDMGWGKVADLVKSLTPTHNTGKRGEFGEAMSYAILQEFHGLVVPVVKQQFKITRGQSLPGIDIIALKVGDGSQIDEVCYVECKLRTIKDDSAATGGFEQLKTEYATRLPAMLTFVAQRLYERGDVLFEPFKLYLSDRSDNISKDKFVLSLCWDKDKWDETALTNLDEKIEVDGEGLNTLIVEVIRLQNLVALTDEVFTRIGVTEISDDE